VRFLRPAHRRVARAGPIDPARSARSLTQGESTILLSDTLDEQLESLSVEERIGKAMRTSGMAILVGHLAGMAALLAGLSSDLPGVAAVCMYGASSVACGVISTFLLLLPAAVLDERRKEANMISCWPCLKVPAICIDEEPADNSQPANNSPPAKPDAESGGRYAPGAPAAAPSVATPFWARVFTMVADKFVAAIYLPPVSLVLVVAFAACASVSARERYTFEIGIVEREALPSDSHVIDAINVEEKYFGGRFMRSAVVFEGLDYEDAEARKAIGKGLVEVDDLDFLFYRWDMWTEVYGMNGPANGGYTDELSKFLNKSASLKFREDVACDTEECLKPAPTKFELLYTKGKGGIEYTHGRRDQIEKAINSGGDAVNAFVWNPYFLTTALDEVILERTLNHVYAAAACAALVLLVLASPLVGLCGAFTMGAAVSNLLGLLLVLEVKLTFISYTCLAMSAALLVVPTAHVGCAFGEALDDAHREAELGEGGAGGLAPSYRALRVCIRTAGSAVMRNAMILVAALLLLRNSESVAFVPLYQVSICAVGLGAMHALFCLPALLTLALWFERLVYYGRSIAKVDPR
jgi:predicted RND superfamily exporter protein